MDGFVAVTDPAWWRELARQPGLNDEANFWRPSPRAFRLPIGTPFFFKLKAPHNAIGGFGYFAGFSVLPDWLAWETFGTANGVPDLAALRGRLDRIRAGARIADAGGQIGCCLIAECAFFPESAWVRPPRDWSPRTQTGARIDLASAEGRRIWDECIARVPAPRAAMRESAERYGAPVLHRPRLGQSIFRIRVLDAYGRACSVTTEHSLPVLDVAHIKPYAQGGEHSVANGLVLRTDLHRLFDRGYLTVGDGDRLVVSRRLEEEWQNGRAYYELQGRRLALPADADQRPDRAALAWHQDQVFLG